MPYSSILCIPARNLLLLANETVLCGLEFYIVLITWLDSTDMTYSTLARTNMVRNQLLPNRIENAQVLQAMSTLPREYFVPKNHISTAYLDKNVPLGNGHFIPDPTTFAKLAQLAHIDSNDTVLDIGCGTGYSTAVFASIARKVIAIEPDETLASTANATLNKLNIRNAIIISEPPSKGSFYEVIFLNGAVKTVPPAFFEQLAENGRLVAVIQQQRGLGQARCFRRSGDTIISEASFGLTLPAFLLNNYKNTA